MSRWASLPASLSARLVATTVLLVAVVAALIGTATTLAMRSTLDQRLDRDVAGALIRFDDALRAPRGARFDPSNQAPGTLLALLADDRPGAVTSGIVLGEGFDSERDLSSPALEELAGVAQRAGTGGDPATGRGVTVELPRVGDYRVRARETALGTLVVGLPTEDVEDTIASLVRVELLLGLLAVVVAAGLGTLLVRRQLRPLREVAGTARHVATLPLAEGEIDLAARVPAPLTDERTEVGAVGSALNALLAHVETSLAARHRSEQQVRQFVADASHELRTPLATIQGYAELARRRPEATEQVLTALTRVEGEAGRMTALVEDLLLLARLDGGRPLEREGVDLTHLLLETVSDARVLAPGHHWRLDLPEEAVEVVGDEARLHQVVTNLLTNARRYTPPGTTVTVRVRPGLVEVHDDGPGFPPALVPHAFERFVRGDAARARSLPQGADDPAPGDSGDAGTDSAPDSGTGLGLSLVAAIVAAHGGTVALDSAPGDTRVRVSLPTA